MSKKLTLKEIQSRIDGIEGNYYKGYNQTEEWWRVTGDVSPTDRRLWTFYHGLKNKREKEEELNMVGDYEKRLGLVTTLGCNLIIKDLLDLLIKAQRLLDKCEDELGGFITPARAIRRDINEAIRKYSNGEENGK